MLHAKFVMEMKTRDQLKPPSNASLYEDYQERGLRILGTVIARYLRKHRRNNEDMIRYQNTGNLSASGDMDEDIS